MVIAPDAGNIDGSNGEERVVFVFHEKTHTEETDRYVVTATTSIPSQVNIFFLLLLIVWLKVKKRQGYVSEQLTLDCKYGPTICTVLCY